MVSLCALPERILRSHVDMVHGKPLTVIFSFALPLLVGQPVQPAVQCGRHRHCRPRPWGGRTGRRGQHGQHQRLPVFAPGRRLQVSASLYRSIGARKNTMNCAGCWAHSRPCCWRGLLCWLRWVRHWPSRCCVCCSFPQSCCLPASHTCASRLGCCWAMHCITLPGPCCAARVIRAHRSPPWLHRACVISRWIYGSS